MYTKVLPSGESLTNYLALMCVEVGQLAQREEERKSKGNIVRNKRTELSKVRRIMKSRKGAEGVNYSLIVQRVSVGCSNDHSAHL